jgi:hypothetical protein
MDANFRWFEGEKAQYRFVPYDWAFLFRTRTVRSGRSRLADLRSYKPSSARVEHSETVPSARTID